MKTRQSSNELEKGTEQTMESLVQEGEVVICEESYPLATVVYPHVPATEGELSLRVGDMISVYLF
jgi:hypothetical protein